MARLEFDVNVALKGMLAEIPKQKPSGRITSRGEVVDLFRRVREDMAEIEGKRSA